jgi:hypothetical protein
MKDRHGNQVKLRDVVRVLEIAPELLAILPSDERLHIEGMLNNEFAIEDFPEEGKASVSLWRNEGEGRHAHGGLYMLSHEFELVRRTGE